MFNLEKLTAEAVARKLGGATGSGREWKARCPCHDDHTPSLSIKDTEDGRLLVKCFAGCTQNEVVAELKRRGLWSSVSRHPAEGATAQPFGLAAYAGAKKLPLEFLRGLGVEEFSSKGKVGLKISYRDRDGRETVARLRWALEGDGKFSWRKGHKPMLYGLDRLKG